MVFTGTFSTRGTVFLLNFTTLTKKINFLWKWHSYEHIAHTASLHPKHTSLVFNLTWISAEELRFLQGSLQLVSVKNAVINNSFKI